MGGNRTNISRSERDHASCLCIEAIVKGSSRHHTAHGSQEAPPGAVTGSKDAEKMPIGK